MTRKHSAQDVESVAALYRDMEVAETYIRKRFSHAWGRLLHRQQVAEVNRVIRVYRPERVLEIAPGPARITTELQGVRHGVGLEYSEAMLTLAQRRLAMAGLADVWELRRGDAFELDRLQCQFDFVYTFRFIRHFQQSDRTRLYHSIATCLPQQGLCMFDVVNRTVREKLDAQQPSKPPGELDVYDETYSPETFRQEMQAHGFEVLRLVPVMTHFTLQSSISYRLDRHLPMISDLLVRMLEKIPSTQPLEWIALCRNVN
jgi:cyclopropane fatty-acyl-phospholipid synthase-like methyltransferase